MFLVCIGPEELEPLRKLHATCPQDVQAFLEWNLDPQGLLPLPPGPLPVTGYAEDCQFGIVQIALYRDPSPAEFRAALEEAAGGPGKWAAIKKVVQSRP